ncbi:MAG TPA: hypothetical protein VFL13_10370 [Candidatus Baltobacteraceae bacterium]|nr:hypothetical protein [Candidatus Baltobacteraceae bacterium]
MRKSSLVWWAGLGAAAVLAACSSGNSTAVAPPVPEGLPQSGPVADSYSQSGSNITVTGPITSIVSSTEFSVNAGTGCGTLHVYTSSSTTWTPAGAKAVTGENVTASGTGSCATNVQAASVKVNSSATPTPSGSATPSPLPASRTIGSGGTPFGLDDAFNPTDGDTASGGNGQSVDGIPCATTMPNTYHVHAFVGIIINGRQYAVPDGVGLNKPGADSTYAGFTNWTEYATSCYYYTHTHDASGVVHIEAPNSVPQSTYIYKLQNFFDVWGQKISSTQIGPFTGTVTAYVAQVPLKQAQITSSMYTTYSGNPANIPLKSHTTVWLQIGPKIYTPSQLPVLNYYEEY